VPTQLNTKPLLIRQEGLLCFIAPPIGHPHIFSYYLDYRAFLQPPILPNPYRLPGPFFDSNRFPFSLALLCKRIFVPLHPICSPTNLLFH
jgi:hypothetical protein